MLEISTPTVTQTFNLDKPISKKVKYSLWENLGIMIFVSLITPVLFVVIPDDSGSIKIPLTYLFICSISMICYRLFSTVPQADKDTATAKNFAELSTDWIESQLSPYYSGKFYHNLTNKKAIETIAKQAISAYAVANTLKKQEKLHFENKHTSTIHLKNYRPNMIHRNQYNIEILFTVLSYDEISVSVMVREP